MIVFLLTISSISQAFKVNIVCESVEDQEWEHFEAVLTCVNKVLEVNHQDTEVEQVLDKFGNDISEVFNIEALDIQETDMKFIPKGIKTVCPRLKALNLRNTGLMSMKREDFTPFGSELEYVSFRANNIIALDSDIFADNPNIKFISFQSNRLRFIEPEFFENARKLTQLAALNMIDCTCISKYYTSNSLSEFNERSEDYKCNDPTAKTDDSLRLNTLETNESEKMFDVRVQQDYVD